MQRVIQSLTLCPRRHAPLSAPIIRGGARILDTAYIYDSQHRFSCTTFWRCPLCRVQVPHQALIGFLRHYTSFDPA